MNTVISFIVVLGILIFVHEFGHFLLAKLFGVKVLKFSLGFGPKVFGKVIGETEYLISAFPLGGYVKMLGENPDEQNVEAEYRQRSFAHKPVLQRFCIVLAGPLFNLLFAVFLFFVIYSFAGLPVGVDNSKIGKVSENSPAAAAGIKPGDLIVKINGQETGKWADVLNGVKESGGKPLTILLQRGAEQLEVQATPAIDDVKNIFGEVVEKRYMIGIMKDEEIVYTRVNPLHAFTEALRQTWMFIYLTVMGLIKILQRIVPATELGGPILIAQLAGEQMKAGWANIVSFTALLSVNLGVLNLLPIPVLDGGHLVFLTCEGIRRRPISEKAQIFAQKIGIAFLGTLMVFVFYNDILRLFK
ncbi:MAG: RIP metalloprotease RseP [Desulfocapsaceae bacterium]|nr:RIP metalloprotease RseP [Desulfocapsaceae bacterium]